MMDKLFLGIDTSNYTTSLAVVDTYANLVNRTQQLLTVKAGQRGLRQSEALFYHVKNLPELFGQLSRLVPNLKERIAAVAATIQPRPTEDSYMPVFLPGDGLGRTIASLLQVPFYALSHQENHIWAGLASAKGPIAQRFLAVHLSGGTSEILKVQVTESYGFTTTILGQTQDLHAGQFVDRLGVALGIQFPAGAAMEKLAQASTKDLVIPSYHKDGIISFAGPETAARRLLGQEEAADICKAVFMTIARTITKLIDWAMTKTGLDQVLVVGGVAANQIIRQHLQKRLPKADLFFAAPNYSTDNAIGAAYYAGLNYLGQEFYGNVFL
ncbi:MAG: O-sialoglycoprotein endopeptidase [Firmicutes bacterium]|nr:O-sialoglycoprotein endopeptidase [Bacillota bacterium]